MSDRIEEMRSDISKVYLNTTWKKKVARMPDKQVMAIYYNFLARGMFGHVPKPIHSRRDTSNGRVTSSDSHTHKEPVVEPEKHFTADQAQQLAFDL